MIDKINEIMDKFKVNKKEEINTIKSDFLGIQTSKYYLNNGEVITRDLVIKPLKDAAMVIPKTIDNKYVVVVQPRIATERGVTVEFPAGYIEAGEDALVGIKRELEEETGYTSNQLEVLREYYADIGSCNSILSLCIAYNCTKVTNQKLDKDEYVEYLELTFDELLELAKQKYIIDCNTLLGIEIIKNMNK